MHTYIYIISIYISIYLCMRIYRENPLHIGYRVFRMRLYMYIYIYIYIYILYIYIIYIYI